MTRMKRAGAFFLLSFSFFVGCNYHVDYINKGPGEDQTKFFKPTTIVGWDLVRDHVLNQCADCHSGLKPPTFTSIGQVQALLPKILDQVTHGIMPPVRAPYVPLSACQVATLKLWNQINAPEISEHKVAEVAECHQPEPDKIPIEDMPLNYQTLKTQILVPKCERCHSPNSDSTAKDKLFDPYDLIANDPVNRWSSPAAQSKIIRSLTRKDKFRMPPPDDSDALTPNEIDFISRWIDAGRPEM
jgi:hypothetical protein